ncbi:MAG: glutamate--tRNA ligase [Deltaproteobacteria bacterium]|nr:glutamate--tRNA ligase [Deltaproteobacteria bacterium]
MSEIRVRIAPSPTGDPHVGTAYITLFNYAFAKKNGGKLILRIEDTDEVRSKESSEEQIMTSLKWLGLQWDEGPDCGGEYGPYKQSERKHIHRQHADKLLDIGAAYRCFCSSKRLAELRAKQKEQGLKTKYDGKCRSLGDAELEKLLSSRKSYVVRMKVPKEGVSKFHDVIRGDIEIENDLLDDQILLKSDGFPTYHLANVVDDHLMKITHVIRAEEWVNSTPKHVILYDAFGWEKPQFVHLPLLRNADRSKISKRKNPISLNYYRKRGILPKALVNFLGLMGWSYSAEKEIFSVEEMIEKFDLRQIHLGGPIFDLKKLTWMNHHYVQKMDEDEFADYVREEMFSREHLKHIHQVLFERLETLDQFVEKGFYFFSPPPIVSMEEVCPPTRQPEEVKAMLNSLLEHLDVLYVWEMVHIQEIIDKHRTQIDWKPKEYLPVLRLILTGRKDSPPLSKTIEIMGREISRQRIRDWIT